MTTIILTIIGILLAAAAALMVIFYGGDAFNAGSIGAKANMIINAGTNVIAATDLAEAHLGKLPELPGPDNQDRLNQFAALSNGAYLKTVPELPDNLVQGLTPSASYYYVLGMSLEVCARINADLKIGTVAPGTDGKSKTRICVPGASGETSVFYANY